MPAPLGPTMAVSEPASSVPLRWCTAGWRWCETVRSTSRTALRPARSLPEVRRREHCSGPAGLMARAPSRPRPRQATARRSSARRRPHVRRRSRISRLGVPAARSMGSDGQGGSRGVRMAGMPRVVVRGVVRMVVPMGMTMGLRAGTGLFELRRGTHAVPAQSRHRPRSVSSCCWTRKPCGARPRCLPGSRGSGTPDRRRCSGSDGGGDRGGVRVRPAIGHRRRGCVAFGPRQSASKRAAWPGRSTRTTCASSCKARSWR